MNDHHLKVVPLRAEPLLNDLPGRLRHLADRIESGGVGPFSILTIVGVYPDQFVPFHACFGDNPDRHMIAGLYAHLSQLALTDKDYDS